MGPWTSLKAAALITPCFLCVASCRVSQVLPLLAWVVGSLGYLGAPPTPQEQQQAKPSPRKAGALHSTAGPADEDCRFVFSASSALETKREQTQVKPQSGGNRADSSPVRVVPPHAPRAQPQGSAGAAPGAASPSSPPPAAARSPPRAPPPPSCPSLSRRSTL